MTVLEMLFLGGVIAAFVSFAATLAWVAHIDDSGTPTRMPAGED